MDYRPALWDGSDPLYAPNTARTKDWLYWKPTKKFVDAGFSKTQRRLPGRIGDDNGEMRAQLAREYTREMLRWVDNAEPKIEPGTWKHLIAAYLTDDFSPFQDLKENTKVEYRRNMTRWEEAIGTAMVRDGTLPEIKGWQRAMATNGRSAAYQKRQFTALRILISYGVSVHFEGAKAVEDVLRKIRVKGVRARAVSPTEAQITAIIAAADDAMDHMFALGLSLQWWLTLRAVDVRGQWLAGDAGGIRKNGKYWADGLTWGMIDRDLTVLRKTPSKTEETLPDELVYDLMLVPDLRRRLAEIPNGSRVGPVIVQRNGVPYSKRRWATLFARYRKAAQVPDHIWCMDTRAGAINHAKRAGASHIELQHQANHAQASTTDRYIRERSESVNKVIQLRTRTG